MNAGQISLLAGALQLIPWIPRSKLPSIAARVFALMGGISAAATRAAMLADWALCLLIDQAHGGAVATPTALAQTLATPQLLAVMENESSRNVQCHELVTALVTATTAMAPPLMAQFLTDRYRGEGAAVGGGGGKGGRKFDFGALNGIGRCVKGVAAKHWPVKIKKIKKKASGAAGAGEAKGAEEEEDEGKQGEAEAEASGVQVQRAQLLSWAQSAIIVIKTTAACLNWAATNDPKIREAYPSAAAPAAFLRLLELLCKLVLPQAGFIEKHRQQQQWLLHGQCYSRALTID